MIKPSKIIHSEYSDVSVRRRYISGPGCVNKQLTVTIHVIGCIYIKFFVTNLAFNYNGQYVLNIAKEKRDNL